MRIIEIRVDSQGRVTIEAHGYEGTSCVDATQRFRTALGMETNQQFKPEFWNQSQAHHQEQQQ